MKKTMIKQEIETINSDSILVPPYDFHFKVTAGPGAGKTYWLVNHIKNVIRNEAIFKNNPVVKIACITYTNTATEKIKGRLGDFIDRCEVSTIHSYLYKNIVKPYAYLVKDPQGNSELNHKEVEGHDVHFSSYKKRESWLSFLNRQYTRFASQKYVKEGLEELQWKIDQGDDIFLCPKIISNNLDRSKFQNTKYFPKSILTSDNLKKYKKLYWDDGVIDHEDVLYFSYRLLKEKERLRQFISLKFPYIFLDEFQDTNPIQTQIIKLLANAGALIGIIGDPAQSIYSFQGAERQDFIECILDNMRYFKIENNRRSTKNIIDLLNFIRNEADFKQDNLESSQGDNVCVFVSSDKSFFIQKHKAKLEKNNIPNDKPRSVMLVRNNEEVSELKQIFSGKNPNLKTWATFQSVDSYKYYFMYRIISAQELANEKHFEMAIKELLKILESKKTRKPLKEFDYENNKLKIRGVTVSILSELINNRTKNYNLSIMTFYNDFLLPLFKKHDLMITKIGAVRKPESKRFLENTATYDLIANIKLVEDKNHITTIHKSKGAEFENVFLCLQNESELEKYILNPDINDEECRLRYVAISRAKANLFICSPTLKAENKLFIEKLNIEIKSL